MWMWRWHLRRLIARDDYQPAQSSLLTLRAVEVMRTSNYKARAYYPLPLHVKDGTSKTTCTWP